MMIDHKKYGFRKAIIGYLITIIFTLVVVLASIITFTFTLAPKFKGLLSAFIFLIIPLAYFLVYLYANNKIKRAYNVVDKNIQFRFDLTKQILLYVIIMLTLFFIFLVSLYLPLEKRGVNDSPLNITIQPYLIKETFNSYNESQLLQANKIYLRYNITLYIKEPIKLNRELNESEKTLIFMQNCSFIDYLYNLTNQSGNKSIKLILINSNGSIDGMGNFCGKGDLIIMSVGTTMPGWVLSHELGHILSARIECWRFNLMKELSKECYRANWITHDFIRDLQPDFLNQNQVNSIVNSIKTQFS